MTSMQQYAEFSNNSNASISKNFFFIFYCMKCAWNLEHFQKKIYLGLIISEIIDAERRGYLNVVLLQKVIR